MAEFKPSNINIRPLANFTRKAADMGFLLEWDDRQIMGRLRRFRVRLSPTTDIALAAVIAASGNPELSTITTRTDWVEGDEDMWMVAHQTGRKSIEALKEVL